MSETNIDGNVTLTLVDGSILTWLFQDIVDHGWHYDHVTAHGTVLLSEQLSYYIRFTHGRICIPRERVKLINITYNTNK